MRARNITIFALVSLSPFSLASLSISSKWHSWVGIPYHAHASRVETLNRESASCSSLVNSVLTEIHQFNCGSSDFRDFKEKLKSINNVASSYPQIWFKYDHMMYVFSNENGIQYTLHSPFNDSIIEPIASLRPDIRWSKVSIEDLKPICSKTGK